MVLGRYVRDVPMCTLEGTSREFAALAAFLEKIFARGAEMTVEEVVTAQEVLRVIQDDIRRG